ncbi:hypothetical protein AIOL_000263 [Candidatus Rhodobacter oscarellae]|uniref:Glycerophosphoryl diester phosphodiesterase membrane domain-containing protein n=1 Tax=Candidatus Rhodobacter oscarellae TaxID=1675527 RepID=A0A0J9EBX0_9RHOB|nr:hypothetical protein [Candidatus Rhodobacter lobularis]KMW60111.1 hypothetical protein AIOL_000263 [Candidatus Rhodobacter lobularis]
MTSTDNQNFSAPLGAGSIVSESFSVLFGNLVKVVLLGFAGTLIGYLVNGATLGFDVALGIDEPQIDLNNLAGFYAGIGISTVVSMVVYGLVTGIVVQLAYDAKLGRSRPLGAYFGPALAAVVPVAVLSIVVGILTTIGMIALIVGGLWVYAVFSATVPAIVIERAGFGGMGRSAGLTKGYRWPIVGTLILVWVCIFILQFVITFVLGLLAAALGTTGIGLIILLLFAGLIGALGYGLGGIVVALIYARLREIKEGVGVDQIAAVFD